MIQKIPYNERLLEGLGILREVFGSLDILELVVKTNEEDFNKIIEDFRYLDMIHSASMGVVTFNSLSGFKLTIKRVN